MRQVRAILGKTQQDFATWLQLDTSTVSRWERGLVVPTFTVGQIVMLLEALAQHGYTLNDLADMVRSDFSDPNNR